MIVTLESLRQTAERRLPGYLDAALSLARDLGDGRYELASEQVAELARFRPPVGLGDAVQSVIHAGLDIVPMPDALRDKIKGCSKCAERARALNKLVPRL